MHATIPLQMHTTLRYLVWLEGMHISSKCPCLSACKPIIYFNTNRIVGIATLSRQDHRVAQIREVAFTKIVLPQVISRGLLLCPNSLQFHIYFDSNEGLNITEVSS